MIDLCDGVLVIRARPLYGEDIMKLFELRTISMEHLL